MGELDSATDLKRTPLYDLHVRLGARMVAVAGYEMPVQYRSGILKEHLHPRTAAGLFDISHMGQILLRPRSSRVEDAGRALEALVPGDMLGLAVNRQRYTLFTNAMGGILDDLMAPTRGNTLMVVVTAARKAADEAYLHSHLSVSCVIEQLSALVFFAFRGQNARAGFA